MVAMQRHMYHMHDLLDLWYLWERATKGMVVSTWFGYAGRNGHSTCPGATRALVALCSLPYLPFTRRTRSVRSALYHHHKHL